MVPPVRIELTASPLPRARSTPELRRHDDNVSAKGLNITYEVSLYNTPVSCYGDFQKLPHIILLTKIKSIDGRNRVAKRTKQQKPGLSNKGLLRASEREEALAVELRKNLKRRRVRSTSMALNNKPTVL